MGKTVKYKLDSKCGILKSYLGGNFFRSQDFFLSFFPRVFLTFFFLVNVGKNLGRYANEDEICKFLTPLKKLVLCCLKDGILECTKEGILRRYLGKPHPCPKYIVKI